MDKDEKGDRPILISNQTRGVRIVDLEEKWSGPEVFSKAVTQDVPGMVELARDISEEIDALAIKEILGEDPRLATAVTRRSDPDLTGERFKHAEELLQSSGVHLRYLPIVVSVRV